MDQNSPSAAQEAAPPIPAPVPVVRRDVLTRFTRESALIFNERRRKLKAERALLGDQAQGNGSKPAPEPAGSPEPGFTSECLKAVRLQLRRVYSWMKETTDPAQYDKLCSASAKLEEQERRLSDRSLPPVRRAQDQAPAKLGHGSSLFAAGLDDV